MGADLIVHICKGPLKLGKRDLKRATRHVERVVDYAKKVVEALDRVDGDTETSDAQIEADETLLKEAEKHPLLHDLLDEEQHDSISDAEDSIRTVAECDAKDFVDKFAAWWNSGSARDTSWRHDPDNKKLKILVCGDMSWGDSPEGEGYTFMREAYWYGLPQRVGIR